MAIQRWTARDTPGYVDYSNVLYGTFMNAHACHPFDESATDPTTVNNLASVINTTISAPVSGNYYLTGAADNSGNGYIRRSVGGVTTTETVTFAGLESDTGASTSSIYFNSGETITIYGFFENAPASGGFDTNPCTVAMVLYGPEDPPPLPEISNLSVDLSNPVPTQTFTLSWDVDDNGSSITDTRVTNLTTDTTDILTASATEKSYSFPSGTAEGTTWTYRVRVTSDAGVDEEEITVTSALATTATFTATPNSIISGAPVELDWAVVGTYDSLAVSTVTNPTAVGSATVYPLTTTTYTLQVVGPKVETGSLTIEKEVTVYQSAVINSFGFNKSLITEENTSVNLSWNVTGDVDTINISPALPGYTTSTNFAKSDSKTFTYPNVTTEYTIFAYGNGVSGTGAITSTASVNVDLTIDPSGGVGSGETKTFTIPKRALDVTITIAGARGGSGGSDSGGGGGGGGKGRGGTFVVDGPLDESYSLTISAGGKGGNGGSGGGCCAGGGGGGYPSGGNGGNTGPNGWSGGGAGGGGASRISAIGASFGSSEVILAVAGGGGGGGGGSWNTGTAGSGQNAADWLIWSPDDGTMAANLKTGGGGSSPSPDGGGGGGGGGGVLKPNGGGTGGLDKSTKSKGGKGGGSYLLNNVFSSITDSVTNNGDGYGTLSFVYGDWIPDLFSISPQNPLTYNENTEGPSPGETVISDYFTITGINLPITVSANSGAQLQKSGTTSWSNSVIANDNDSFRVRYTTPTTGGTSDAGYDVEYNIVVTAGLIDDEPDDVVSATWQITTRSPDITPDSFVWSDSVQNTPILNQNLESETIVITGFEIPLEITSNQDIEVMINNDGIWRSLT